MDISEIKTQFLKLIKNEKFQRWSYFAITVASIFFILGYLVYRDREVFLNYEWEFHLLPALGSFVFYSASLVWVAGIWGGIMNSISIRKLNFLTHFQFYCVSNITKRLPGTIWYIASRVYLYRKMEMDPKVVSLASGIELIVSVMSSILVGIVFGIKTILDSNVNLYLIGILFFLCVILLHPKTYRRLTKLFKIQTSDISYSLIFTWLILYSVAWILSGILLFIIANIFTSVPIMHLGFVIGSFSVVGALSALVFFLPSNFGVTEVGLSLFLSTILPLSVAVLIAISFRLLVIFYEIVWAGALWKLLPPQTVR
jgi:uncharacterized membrane protein YbhN (UPF0104 family)